MVQKLFDVANKLKAKLTNDALQQHLHSIVSQQNWQAPTTTFHTIMYCANDYDKWLKIQSFIFQKLQSTSWRKVLKTLQLVQFMIKYGQKNVLQTFKDEINRFRQLQDYDSQQSDNAQHSESIRQQARIITKLLSNDQWLEDQRNKARQIKERMGQVTSISIGSQGNTLLNGGTGQRTRGVVYGTGLTYSGIGMDVSRNRERKMEYQSGYVKNNLQGGNIKYQGTKSIENQGDLFTRLANHMPKKNDNNIKTAEINIKQPTRIDQKVVVQSKSDNKQPVVKKSNMDLLGVDTKLVQKGDKTVGKQGMFQGMVIVNNKNTEETKTKINEQYKQSAVTSQPQTQFLFQLPLQQPQSQPQTNYPTVFQSQSHTQPYFIPQTYSHQTPQFSLSSSPLPKTFESIIFTPTSQNPQTQQNPYTSQLQLQSKPQPQSKTTWLSTKQQDLTDLSNFSLQLQHPNPKQTPSQLPLWNW